MKVLRFLWKCAVAGVLSASIIVTAINGLRIESLSRDNLVLSEHIFTVATEVTAFRLHSGEIINPHSALAREAWATALRMAHVEEPWTVPQNIVLFKFPDPEVWGRSFFYSDVDDKGRTTLKEQIVLFCPPRFGPIVVRNVLIHEMLHAIHMRLRIIDPHKYAGIGDEEFVCGLGACPPDPTLTPIRPKE
jgi:hypothetical protein